LNAVTNFDITRYDVDKIMESSNLLPAEEARKVKAIEASNSVPMMHNNGGRELNLTEEISADWRMVHHGSSQEAGHGSEAVDPRNSLHSNDGLDVSCVAHDHHLDVPAKSGGVNFSNSSSLVTSLGNSREWSPERLGLAMIYGKQQQPHAVSLAAMSPWMSMPVPAAQHVVSHLPAFAAWADA